MNRLTTLLATSLGLLFLAPTALWAQDESPVRINVRLIDVKADAVAQFEASIADRAEVVQAAGRPFFHVFERIRGADLPSYSIISMDAAYNELPPLAADPAWGDRIAHSVNGSILMTVEFYPALGIDAGTAPSGEFMRVRVRTTSPSNRQAYFDWIENELTPALREAGVTDLRTGRLIHGGNTNTFVRFAFSDAFPEDGPDVAESLGQREFERLFDREDALLVSSEDVIYRFREDLSFTAEE